MTAPNVIEQLQADVRASEQREARLTAALRDTRARLSKVEQHTDRPSTPRLRGAEPGTPAASTMLLNALSLMRDGFTELPAEYFTRAAGALEADVHCPCGDELHLVFAELRECGCRRFYFNGRRVQVLSATPPEDDTDVCDLCCQTFRVSQGKRVLLSGIDSFVCDGCRGEFA